MLVNVIMDLFNSDLPTDSSSLDPFVTAESGQFNAIAQEPPVDGSMSDPLSVEINTDLVGDELDVAENMEMNSVESDLSSNVEVDVDISDGSDLEGIEAIPDAVEADELVGLPDQVNASPIDDSVSTLGEDMGKSIFDPVFDFVSDIWDRFFLPFFDPDDIVRSGDFSGDGSVDTKNNLVVVGDVASDINFISGQTHGSCSLMAQEQFVHRLTGKPIPEEYLEWQAEKWGVYHPDIGTVTEGQEMILDHFNIPYDRDFNPDLDDIVNSMSKGNDVLIGVDAREFYQDPSIPPGSGHAVALVGRGLDPETGDLKGFYVTDSNYPGAAHFVPTERLEASWDGTDMISVPEHLAA